MKTLAALAITATTVSSTLAFAAPDRPTGTTTIQIGSQFVEVWPYTTNDFERPSDPVNLVFARQRPPRDPPGVPGARRQPARRPSRRRPRFNCTWADAMGYEQAAWAETEGWVGAEIQLACVAAGRAARQPVPLPRPSLPAGRGHAGECPLRVPDSRDGRARGAELGPGSLVRHPRHGADRSTDGAPGGRADCPRRELPGGEAARLRRAGGRWGHPDPRGRRSLSHVGSGRRRRADADERSGRRARRVDHRGARCFEGRDARAT